MEKLRGWLEEANQWLENNGSTDLWWSLLDLSWLDISSIPDLCTLLSPTQQSSIQAIDLSNNKIETVDVDLSCLENLAGIDLSFNNISELLWLWSLPMLRDLRLSQNKIEYLSDSFFSTYPTLQSLKLSYNKLTEVSALNNLKGLLDLQLQHNELVSLVWLENLEKIEQLKLEFNQLKEDQLTYLDSLSQLKKITWGYNEFKEELLENRKKVSE